MSTLKIKRENGKIFCPLADSWHIETPEEKVRQELIMKPLIRYRPSYSVIPALLQKAGKSTCSAVF